MPELSPAYPVADARNAILEAGLTVFAADGFHGATMRKIAERAGVSQPLLHHHFGGKEELWRLVGERITAEFLAQMGAAVDPAASPRDGVQAMLRSYLGYWRARPLAFRFNLWRRLDGLPGERASRSKQMTRHGVAFMRRAQEAGYIRQDLPPGLALIIGGALIQFWLDSQVEIRDALAVTGDEALSDEEFVQHVLRLIWAAEIP